MADEWQTKLQQQIASIPSRVKATRSLYGALGPWLRAYRGGMPVGFFAAIAELESGGKMTAGDPNLGEYGYFQVAATTETQFRLPANARRDPETNVYLGGLEYNVEAVQLAIGNPAIRLGSEDAWKLSRLSFAIGGPGTRKLIAAADVRPGDVFRSLQEYVDRTGGMALGSQSAGKVRYRVHLVDVTWRVGQEAIPGFASLPRIPRAPRGLAPQIPVAVAERIRSAETTQTLATVAAVAAAVLLS